MSAVWRTSVTLTVALASASCAHRNGASVSEPAGRVSDQCKMAAAVLTTAVKDEREEPFGLDVHCVQEYAEAGGAVYVDARFTKNGKLEAASDTSCTKDRFVIRFDSKADPPSSAPGVVLLSVGEPTSTGRPFFVTIEQSHWRERPSNVLAMPPCYPASGILTRTADGSGWPAKVIEASRGPDDL